MGWQEFTGVKRNRRRQRKLSRRRIAVIEQLESRWLLSSDIWTGNGDGATWSNATNWQNGIPKTGDDVTINTPGSATINFTSAAGNVSLDSLTSNTPLAISGGSLTITGSIASIVSANFSMTGGSLSVTGAGGSFTESGSGTISNANLSASGGGILALNGVTALTNVNLTATSSGQIIFPEATSYATNGNTIQASGSNSRINLSALSTFTTVNNDSAITVSTGGEIDLAGLLSGGGTTSSANGGLRLTLSDALSDLNVANVTELIGAAVTATAGTLNFSSATSLIQADLTATGGGQILFPDVTSFASDGNTIRATGNNSRINLSALSTFTTVNSGSAITASTGGEIDLAGLLSGGSTTSSANGGLRLTLSDALSDMNVANVNKLIGTAVTATVGTINFSSATSLIQADLTAASGGQILFPVATSFSPNNNTIQATGSGSKINLSDLSTFNNTGGTATVVGSTGGEIDLTGQLSGTVNLTLSDAISTLNVAGVTSVNDPNGTISATSGTLNFSGLTTITNVNLSAASSGQILCPQATSFAPNNNTIQAMGSGSKINLSDLSTFNNTGGTTTFRASMGGEIDLTGQLNGTVNLTLSDAISTLNVAGITTINDPNGGISAIAGTLNFSALTSITNVNLAASSGAQILFPVTTSFAPNNNTIQADGTGSKIKLSDLSTFNNTGGTATVVGSTGGEIDLTGQLSGTVNLTLSDAISTLNVAGVTSVNDPNGTISATSGTLNFSGLTTITNVNLSAASSGQILCPQATSFAPNNNTIQAMGSGSKINLSDLSTFNNTGGTTTFRASMGGEIDLTGQLNGTVNLTLSDAISTLNVAGITTINDPNGGISAIAGTLNFSGLTAITNVNLTAASGGQILCPQATSFAPNNNTIQANGSGSEINLSDLSTFNNTGGTAAVRASMGGEIDLTGQLSGTVNLTLSDAISTLDIAGVTSVNDPYGTISATSGTLNFSGLTAITNVNLIAANGAQILFPIATNFAPNNNTIQATGSGSKINLSDLGTFHNTGGIATVIASTGGEVDLTGQLSGTINLTLSDAISTLNVASITSINDPYGTISATSGNLNFSALTSLTNVNLTATSGAQILFPIATSFAPNNNTIQATGPGSKIDLSDLSTFNNTGGTATVIASTGGTIDLAGSVSGGLTITLSGATSELNISGITSLTNTTLTAANGATFTLPAGWSPTWDSNDTFTTSGTGSEFVNQTNITLSGQTLNITASAFSNQGILDAINGGTFNISNSFSVDGSGALIGSSSGQFNITGNLLGSTQNANLFAPLATVNFKGSGTSQTPQLLEAMSVDDGAKASAFIDNFNYFAITLSNSTYVRLVDQSSNTNSGKHEAVYVGSLIVPQGATLDLNGLNLYCRNAQISGQIVNGTITQLPVGGSIPLDSPTPADLKTPGELDQWSFFDRGGQSVAIVVNPGGSGSPAAISPQLNWANVELLDSNNNVLVQPRADTSAGGIIDLIYNLPADGTYNININAPSGAHVGSTGNYVVTAYNSTITTTPLVLGNISNGTLVSGYDTDDWTFTATANEAVNFHVLSRPDPNLVFDLAGPNGSSIFTAQGTDSLNLTLPSTGTYTLKAYSLDAQPGSYAFEMDQATPIALTLGQPYNGTFAGNGESELFQVNVPISQALKFTLTNANSGDFTDLYARYNAVPSQQTYDYASTGGGANQVLLAPAATSGEWYVLVYANFLSSASSGNFTLEADSKEAFVTSVSPGTGTADTQTTLTVGGAGFVPGSTISLVGTSDSYVDNSPTVDLPTEITAQFAANTVLPGTYSVMVKQSDGVIDTLPSAFVMSPAGNANLVTNIIMPTILGYSYDATIYIDYTNNGAAAMPAPVLVLTATQGSASDQGAIMTLNPELQNNGLSNISEPPGYSNTIQILASGATPGMLAPGDSEQIPVYYAGWLQNEQDQSLSPITFTLSVIQAGSTTPVNYENLLSPLQPAGISNTAWNAIYPIISTELGGSGGTDGGYVQLLDSEASYLGSLGENVTDAQSLWGFVVQQANNSLPVSGDLTPASTATTGNAAGAFSPYLASMTDDSVPTTGDLSLSFTRSYDQSISGRDTTVGPLGMGWSTSWQTTATPTKIDGTLTAITINEANGAQRIFESDTFDEESFFSQPGDTGTLTVDGSGNYLLTESNGTETEYDSATGNINYVQDAKGNRITANYNASGQLTTLTSSSGPFIHVTYNAKLISSLTDSNGQTTTYTYDPSNTYLMSVTNSNGQTTQYTYDTTSGSPSQNALTAITFPDGTHEAFGYDAQGRLSSITGPAGALPLTITYSLGKIGIATGTGNAPSYYYYNENKLVGKSIDPSGTPTYYVDPNPIPAIGETAGVIGNASSPIPGTPQPLTSSVITPVGSHDPNDLEGPIGYDAATSNWFADNAPLPYTINFQNESTDTGLATAAAQTVKVSDPLSSALNANSLRNVTVTIDPPDANPIEKTINIDTTASVPLSYVGYPDLEVSIHPYLFQGAIYVEFQTIDSNTGVAPSQYYVGFLQINESASVAYNIMPMPGLTTGTKFTNVGNIQFDQNTAIRTDQIDDSDLAGGTDPNLDAAVTIDSSSPDVTPLTYTLSGTTIVLSWTGADVGSGVGTYDVYASTDDVSFTQITQTASKSYTYSGTPGHTYYFYVVPSDNVNNQGASESITVPLSNPLATLDPINQTMPVSYTVTFTAAAAGNPTPTLQWQISTNGGNTFSDIPGATSTTYSFTVSASQNGNEYQAVFTNNQGSTTTNPATLTVTAAPVAPMVTINPTSQSISVGDVTFTAAASGSPTPTVQWQVSTDGGNSFSDIPDATSTTYGFTVSIDQNGNEYQAIFTNSQGSATTNPATLTVTAAPVAPMVTTNPITQSVIAGNTVTLNAAASGTPAPTVQWQVSTDGGVTFSDIPDATSTTYSFTASIDQNGNEYQAIFTNSQSSAATAIAILTVAPAAPHLVFVTEPGGATAGGKLSSITIETEDAAGNLTTTGKSTIKLSLSSGGKLIGTTTASVKNGKAVFSNLSIQKAGQYTISASDPSFASTVSTTFTVRSAAAKKMVFSQEPPGSVRPNNPFSVVMELTDRYGNLATDDSMVTLTLGSHPKGASLEITAPVIDGYADFDSLTLADIGKYTLKAVDGKLKTTSKRLSIT